MADTIELTPEQMQEIVDDVLTELFSENDENLAPFDDEVQMPTSATEIAAYDVAVWKTDADGKAAASGHMNLKQAFDTYVGDKKTELDQYVDTLEDSLDAYVGADGTSGLKKELSDHADTLETDLDTHVNDASSGLLKRMDDHADSLEESLSSLYGQKESSLNSLAESLESGLDSHVNDPVTGLKAQLDSYLASDGGPIDTIDQKTEQSVTEIGNAETQALDSIDEAVEQANLGAVEELNQTAQQLQAQLDTTLDQMDSTKADMQTLKSQMEALLQQASQVVQKQVVAPITIEGVLMGQSVEISGGQPYLVISEIETVEDDTGGETA